MGTKEELGRITYAWISTTGVSDKFPGAMVRNGGEEVLILSFISLSGYIFSSWGRSRGEPVSTGEGDDRFAQARYRDKAKSLRNGI